MEPCNRVRALLHDAHQHESRLRDTDDGRIADCAPRHWLSVLFRLRAWRAAEAAAAAGDASRPRLHRDDSDPDSQRLGA